MVDRVGRTSLALALRKLAAGRVSNYEFEDQLGREIVSSRDMGVKAIRWAAWMLYDDLHEHRLSGVHSLGRAGRRHIARWILFLKSDVEYEWPELPTWLQALLLLPNILTVGLLGSAIRRWGPPRGCEHMAIHAKGRSGSRGGGLAAWHCRRTRRCS